MTGQSSLHVNNTQPFLKIVGQFRVGKQSKPFSITVVLPFAPQVRSWITPASAKRIRNRNSP